MPVYFHGIFNQHSAFCGVGDGQWAAVVHVQCKLLQHLDSWKSTALNTAKIHLKNSFTTACRYRFVPPYAIYAASIRDVYLQALGETNRIAVQRSNT